MALKVMKEINAKLKFVYRQSTYVTPVFMTLIYNILIQPRFDYGRSSSYPSLKNNLKIKLQNTRQICCIFAQIHSRGLVSVHRTLEK